MFGLGLGLSLELGSGGGFSPAVLSGLVFWANAGTLTASPVSSWSYGAANLTQGVGADQPTWSASSSNVGNNPSVIYASPQFLSAANTAALQLTGDLTISAVAFLGSARSFNTIITKGVTSEFDVYVDASSTVTFSANGGPVNGTTGAFPAAVVGIVTITCTSNALAFYTNGIAKGTATRASTTTTVNPVQLGQRSDAGTQLIGEEPEVVMYNRALSANELLKLHRYFGKKYGIAVP